MYLKVEISAETEVQTMEILNALLAKRLVTGGPVVAAAARFLWKGSVTDMDYWTINGFTVETHKEAIIKTVQAISVEEVPMVVFLAMDGNKELLDWIETTVA